MGALHKGHLSLVQESKSNCDVSVVSIFVNPTQFDDKKDLEKYPRTIGQDIELLCSVGNDVLFLPSVEEIYPKDLDTTLQLDFGQLAEVLEGAFRPGHFDGMAQVVNRLLNIVQPDCLFMGQKDFQQVAIVHSMLKQLKSKIDLVVCPIIREEDGLAMSSRNRRLSPEFRQKSILLSQTLAKIKAKMTQDTPQQLRKMGLETLSEAGFKPEYFDIVDGFTLLSIDNFSETSYVVALTAAWAGEIRLIDNMIIKQPTEVLA